jgi:hypothetical protein
VADGEQYPKSRSAVQWVWRLNLAVTIGTAYDMHRSQPGRWVIPSLGAGDVGVGAFFVGVILG